MFTRSDENTKHDQEKMVGGIENSRKRLFSLSRFVAEVGEISNQILENVKELADIVGDFLEPPEAEELPTAA